MDYYVIMSVDSDMSDMDCCYEDVMDISDCVCLFNVCIVYLFLLLNDLVVKLIK